MTQTATLESVPLGSYVVLERPLLGPAHQRRLAELGLRTGVRIAVTMRTVGGGRVLAIDDSRVAIDRHTARCMPVVATTHPN